MRERRLVGISQYDHHAESASAEVVLNAAAIRASIEAFHQRFASVSHLDTVVFDVAFVGESPCWPATPVLIEINPLDVGAFGTDPCLFEGAELDGSFRYLGDGAHEPVARCSDALWTDMLVAAPGGPESVQP